MATTAKTTLKKTTIHFRRHGHLVVMQPAVPELLLTFFTVDYQPVQQQGSVRIARRPVPLIRIDGDEMVFLAGLAQLVADQLRQWGYRVVDHGRDEDSKLNRVTIPRSLDGPVAEPTDAAFLQRVASSVRGLVRYGPNVSPGRLIAQFALTNPQRGIACAVTRVSEGYELRNQLARRIKCEPIQVLNHRTCPTERARIVIGTYTYLGGGEADLHNRDIVFAMDPTEMLLNYDGRAAIGIADQSRLFGFLSRERALTQSERDRCTMVFGSDELVIPKHGQFERPIEALFLPVRGEPELDANLPLHKQLRENVWKHPVRNRRIARLALALATGDSAALTSLVKNKHTLRVISACGPHPRVGILCDSVEHALELCGRLRGWRLITGSPVRIDGVSVTQRKLLRFSRRQPNRPGQGFIVTETGLARVRHCDVLIRADSGLGSIPTHWTNNTNVGVFDYSPVFVVDFWDHYDRVLWGRSRQRRDAYLSAGFRLPVEYPMLLDQFIATRPRLKVSR